MSSLKKTDIRLGTVDLNIKKQVISKPYSTVVLCYLALNVFYVSFFAQINLMSFKMIILNYFL